MTLQEQHTQQMLLQVVIPTISNVSVQVYCTMDSHQPTKARIVILDNDDYLYHDLYIDGKRIRQEQYNILLQK